MPNAVNLAYGCPLPLVGRQVESNSPCQWRRTGTLLVVARDGVVDGRYGSIGLANSSR